MTGVKDALNYWTEYGYDELGRLVSQEDANDHVTRYEYDKVGRRTATVLPLNQRSTTTYDEVGNVKSVTDFNGETTLYRYDEQNRLIEKDFDDDPTVTMTYTANGLVKTITDGRGVTQFDYDERDRLKKRTDPDGKWIAYGYDAASNRTWVKTATSETRYTFDERNWLDTVIAASGITNYDYNAVGNLVHTQFGNGTIENRQYDDLNRLVYLENKKADGSIFSSYTYTLDKVGNRLLVTEPGDYKTQYTYDDLYRLTQEKIWEAGNATRTTDYTYDNVGNRLTKVDLDGSTIYTYDANDRLLEEKVNGQVKTTYTYDNNGNTFTKTEPGQQTTYTWDDQNRLVAADITTAGGTKRLEYQYDINGIRVASKVDGQETRYLIDTVQPYAQVLEEYTPDGTVLSAYVYGNDLVSQTHYDPQTQVGNTTYYHIDGLGSTTVLTDAGGNVVSTSRYEAFGEKTSGTGNIDNKYLFAGEQYDSNLGDYYLRARYYNSSIGRFTRRDTWEGKRVEPLTLHKYLYAGANPTIFIDPSGLQPVQTQRGGQINNIIGQFFIAEDPENREYDRYGAYIDGSRQLTLLRIIRRALNDESDPGVSGYNGRRADLVDFGDYQIYEIKPSNLFQEGLAQTRTYLNVLNGVSEMPAFWTAGDEFVPPPFVVTDAGDIAWVRPPVQGVITYDILNQSLTFLAYYVVFLYTIQAINELVAQTASASVLARYGAV